MRDDVYVNSVAIDWESVTSRGEYPFAIPAIASIDVLDLGQSVTFFCGENGTGKSTLLEALSVAYGLNAEGGTKNHRFSTVDAPSELAEHLVLMKSIFKPSDNFLVRSDTMYNLITEMDRLGDGDLYHEGRALHTRSHGEGVLALVSQRFHERGFYVLDEPESGLSQCGQVALLAQIIRLAREGAQFIIATHSPILLTAPGATIYQFDDEVREVTPEETMEWIMLHRFLENPERELAFFLEE